MNITNGFISAMPDKKPAKPDSRKATRGHRLSLPQTIDSSTKVNAEKVQRRLSSRFASKKSNQGLYHSPSKSSILSNSNRENKLPPYSPPQTRSAKQQKRNGLVNSPSICKRSGVLLEFSPPDQAENERRENEYVQRTEEER